MMQPRDHTISIHDSSRYPPTCVVLRGYFYLLRVHLHLNGVPRPSWIFDIEYPIYQKLIVQLFLLHYINTYILNIYIYNKNNKISNYRMSKSMSMSNIYIYILLLITVLMLMLNWITGPGGWPRTVGDDP